MFQEYESLRSELLNNKITISLEIDVENAEIKDHLMVSNPVVTSRCKCNNIACSISFLDLSFYFFACCDDAT